VGVAVTVLTALQYLALKLICTTCRYTDCTALWLIAQLLLILWLLRQCAARDDQNKREIERLLAERKLIALRRKVQCARCCAAAVLC
jgi:hypothetical protein